MILILVMMIHLSTKGLLTIPSTNSYEDDGTHPFEPYPSPPRPDAEHLHLQPRPLHEPHQDRLHGLLSGHRRQRLPVDRPGHHPGAGPGDRKGRRACHPPGAQHPQRPHLHHRGAGSDRRELHRRASAEIRACPGAVGGVHTGLSRDMGRDTVEKTAVTAS